ncbi:MAG: hypothetical protein AAF441_17155 [Pseudomonadota bacterium]
MAGMLVPYRYRRLLPLALALLSAPPSTGAQGAGTVTFVCRPALPVYCRNVHVGCSGKTGIRTAVIEISIRGDRARLVFAGDRPPARGNVSGSGYILIRLDGQREWLRIEADGRFSHRIYPDERAAMSYGQCSK